MSCRISCRICQVSFKERGLDGEARSWPIAKIEAVKAMCEAVLLAKVVSLRDSIHHGKLYMGDSSNPIRTGALPPFTKFLH